VTALSKIITVGLSPAWDITCRGERLDWGLHKDIHEQTARPAGKALNISRALAWMGVKNVAAGIWGQDDFEQMLKALRSLRRFVKVKMTAVEGGTRRNITVVDTANNREMHLRDRSELARPKALKKLLADLEVIVHRGSVCVFAGAMPEKQLLGEAVRIIKSCSSFGAKIVLDTSGEALREIVDAGVTWLIKPNVEELRQLLGEKMRDSPAGLARAGRKLVGKVEIILISRGKKGAIAVTKEGVWQGRCIERRRVLSTVGCGDFLLAGFLKGLKDKSDAGSALRTAIKVATARAWGWTEGKSWPQALREIKVAVERV